MAFNFLQSKVHDAIHFLFPKNCFEEIILNFNILHKECVPLVLSRGLGLGVTIGSILLFMPQILKIFAAKSGKGISLSSQLLALIAATGTAAYSYSSGFVFSQWGDSLFVAIQIAVIIMQILFYSSQSAFAFAFLAACWATFLAIAYNYIPFSVLTLLQTATIPIMVISKGIQIYENQKNKSTGVLSFISATLSLAGCLARVFTSIQETGDNLIIVSFGIAALLNGVIFAQFLMFWNSTAMKIKTKKSQ
uniref:Mannose-P-dolichol utilization defect 1 protein homolog n=1 Tax=Rhabditophanes sp. KR3021 TaxID=114890 RepID=A0AC35TQE2_9BILA